MSFSLARRWPADSRCAGEPEAVAEVIGWCGRLPLAVGIAAGVLADDPDLTVAEFAAELRESTTRLVALNDDTGGVHAVFVTSWRRLRARHPDVARLLCLLTVNPGPDLSTEAAAAITGQEPVVVRVGLRVLRQVHLLLAEQRRWRFHDLIRLDAQQRHPRRRHRGDRVGCGHRAAAGLLPARHCRC